MQTAIASSSISPYMWMSSGPSSKKPLDGEGIDAITGGILPVRAGRVPLTPRGGPQAAHLPSSRKRRGTALARGAKPPSGLMGSSTKT